MTSLKQNLELGILLQELKLVKGFLELIKVNIVEVTLNIVLNCICPEFAWYLHYFVLVFLIEVVERFNDCFTWPVLFDLQILSAFFIRLCQWSNFLIQIFCGLLRYVLSVCHDVLFFVNIMIIILILSYMNVIIVSIMIYCYYWYYNVSIMVCLC